MDALLLNQVACRRCDAALDSADNFCRHCGAPTTDEPESPAAPRPARPVEKQSLRDNPWAMLGMLFLAIGPLALPLLWSGRAFGRLAKFALTLLVIGQTMAIIWAAYYFTTTFVLTPLNKAFQF